MVRPLSMDLRTRVADALDAGLTCRSAARRFGVSVATAVRIGQLRRSGRGLHPGKMGGHRGFALTGATADWLRARLVEKPDLTMRGLTAELAARGVVVSHDTVWRFVRRTGVSFKKNTVRARTGQAEGGAASAALANLPAQA